MSANTGIVTYGGYSNEVSQYYYSAIAQNPATLQPENTRYCFISKVDPWPNESAPPIPSLSEQNIKTVFKNMIAIKRVLPADMRPLADRFDWTLGQTYGQYQDNINLFDRDGSGVLLNKFYAKNKYDQVFKCLWNNNGGAVSDEPHFLPGQMSSTNVFTGADGYKWVYLYTIEGITKQNFLDSKWLPLPTANYPGLGTTSVNSGNIPIVGVIDGGANYYQSNTVVNIIGTHITPAKATAVVSGGIITDIIVTDPGSGYISATIQIVSSTGTGANAIVYVSPINGHGSDPFQELGCRNMMVTQTFTGNEGGIIPTDIKYRQLGFIVNPVSKTSYPYQCQQEIYSLTTDIIVTTGTGSDGYISDEVVFQSIDNTLANASFTATCLSFGSSNNLVKLINTSGTANANQLLIGDTSETIRTVLFVSPSDVIPYSGYITYIENRQGIQRSVDGTEQVRLIVEF